MIGTKSQHIKPFFNANLFGQVNKVLIKAV